jgi:hypothetical protein
MLGGDHNGCLPKKIETVHEENLECAGWRWAQVVEVNGYRSIKGRRNCQFGLQ